MFWKINERLGICLSFHVAYYSLLRKKRLVLEEEEEEYKTEIGDRLHQILPDVKLDARAERWHISTLSEVDIATHARLCFNPPMSPATDTVFPIPTSS